MSPCLVNTVIINIVCHFFLSFYAIKPAWVCFLKILWSHDVELNPSDFTIGFLNFCNWNVNSLSKDNFHRVQLLGAHNSICNYDIISLSETSLNYSAELPDPFNNYTFISSISPNNKRHGGMGILYKNSPKYKRHGGVGLLYKNSLPVKVREDISFNETIVVVLKFGGKKIFFTVLYRSPAHTNGTNV